ncbi:hypothetical protein GFD30_25725, partial [Glycomyces sp. NEAU-7082]|nr:hypothetical protein [Glycomyces albidus]
RPAPPRPAPPRPAPPRATASSAPSVRRPAWRGAVERFRQSRAASRFPSCRLVPHGGKPG